MLRLNVYRGLMFVAMCSLALVASTASAKDGRKGGHGHSRGHGHLGGHGHIGHGNHIGHGHHGGRQLGYVGHPHSLGRRYGSFGYGGLGYGGLGYGGIGYGSNFGRGYYGRGFGIGIVIGGGYPYRYRGFVSPYADFGYSPYSPYHVYPPYYPNSSALYWGSASVPRYDAPAPNYVYPETPRYQAAKPAMPQSDLRPGMILPDGSRVLSVEPIGPTVQGGAIAPETLDQDGPVPTPTIPETDEIDNAGDQIEELPPVAPDEAAVDA